MAGWPSIFLTLSIIQTPEAQADRIVEICDDPYEPWKMQKRNEWMVDNSDADIAVWNSQPGGTKN
jgi:uncharacterized phage-like protein YoqJ